MNINRSMTPPKLNTTFPYVNTKLNDKEFPIYNDNGTRMCPPAPPPKTKEVRVCSCKRTYQIVFKNSPVINCGNCA